MLDGPVYPTGLLSWVDRDPALRRLIVEETEFTGVVENYRRLVERFVERSVPLIGFVKNTTTKAITQLLRQKTGAPWVDDAAFFRRVLERQEGGDRQTGELTFTNWFRSQAGSDGLLVDGEVSERSLRVAGTLEPTAYELTFFMIYDPRDDLLYRIEAPHAFTRDPAVRDRLRRYALCAVAAEGGPPLAIEKADELARISRDGKQALRRRIERVFGTERRTEYNDKRWGDQRSGPQRTGHSAR
ncbi:MAG: NurA domain protein [halophilic archaeon J07HX5]|nr:MAG: NurA domain protein [halophilic archaeon J07HX5]